MTRRTRSTSGLERRLDALETEQSDDPPTLIGIIAEPVGREEP